MTNSKDKKLSLKEFINKFLEFEDNNNLFDIEISDMKVWEYTRFSIYQYLFSIYFQTSYNFRGDIKSKFNIFIKAFFNYLNSVIKYNLFLKKNKTEILIFNHPRRQKDGNYFLDIHTDPLLKELNKKFIVLESSYSLEHFKPAPTKNLIYIDWLEFPYRVLANLKNLELTNRDSLLINDIVNKIKKEFNLVNEKIIYYTLERLIKRYNILKNGVKKLILKYKPKMLIVVDSYTIIHRLAIEQAKKLSIPTIELQHGVMGPYHIAYKFKNLINIKSFPDYIFVWGNHWKKNTKFPVKKENIKVTGFPYLESKKKSLIFNKEFREKNILIISGGINQKTLSQLIISCLKTKKLDEYRFIYKLHPIEYRDAMKTYPELYSNKNIQVIDNNNKSIYDFFAISEFQIGVFSTALFEGLAFGLKTIIVKLPGWEYMESIQGKAAVFVTTKDELVEAITNYNDKFCNDSVINEFWEPNSINNINNEIQKIIKSQN